VSRPALVLALLVAATPGLAGPVTAAVPRRPSSPALVVGPPGDIQQAMARLLDEDVAGTADFIEAWSSARPLESGGRLALGLLRFFQHRYEEAVPLLELALAGQHDPEGLLRIARNAARLAKDWALAESDHFQVAYPKGKDEVLVPYLLETLEAQRAALETDLKVAPPGKVRVEILPSVTDLARLSTLSEAEIRSSGTIALCKYGKLMLVSPKALVTGYDWLDTAAHEYTHFVVSRKAGPGAPIWLHEGVAKWWESRWRGAGGEDYSPSAAALVRRAIETNTLVTFEKMHPSMAKLPTQEMASLAYAQVLLAVEYLVQRGGTALVARVLDLVGTGTPADAAVAQALGTSWGEFNAQWRGHMATRPLPRGGAGALRRLRFKDDPEQGGPWAEWADLPDQASRNHARLGQLLRERGRWVGARVEYRKALDRAGARVPILANQYAIAAIQTGRAADAERVLLEAIGWTPDYAALRVQLARLLVGRKAFAEARAQLVLANRQDPFDPEIHAGLAMAAEALGDPGGASRERRFAEILQGSPHGPPGAQAPQGHQGQGNP
jgi:tetratricopeptide (TPR) repeat protein